MPPVWSRGLAGKFDVKFTASGDGIVLAGGEENGKTDAGDPREHLANERTLLAWVRTGVALISIGIVVERVGILVEGGDELSGLLGLALAGLGCSTLVLGAYQFWSTRRQLMRGSFVPASTVYLMVVAGGLALGGCFFVYALLFG